MSGIPVTNEPFDPEGTRHEMERNEAKDLWYASLALTVLAAGPPLVIWGLIRSVELMIRGWTCGP